MSAPMSSMIGDGEVDGDVRRPSLQQSVGDVTTFDPMHTAHQHDPSIRFEEYLYYAEITRAEEVAANEAYIAARGPRTARSLIKDRFSKGPVQPAPASGSAPTGTDVKAVSNHDEKNGDNGTGADTTGAGEAIMTRATPQEWKQASRALRTAGWGGVFYLITTDILGPFTTPWAFAQMGYGPGFALFTVFGIMSYYSGWIMWKTFLDLDSDRYPMRGYGDLYFRIFGPLSRHLINIAQGLQLLLFVAILILQNGQSISQISQGPNGGAGICFVACLIIFMCCGFVLGQIRTLQRFSWIANISVYLNVLQLFIILGVAAHSPPNFSATQASFGDTFGPGPVITYAGTPPDGMASGGEGFVASLNGLNQAVYSYGGCMIFAAFMAEMRHPHDFWKSLLIAEIFIYAVYVTFGMAVYSEQGQFSFNPVQQGLSPYNWQTAVNIMNIITGLIAAALYGNIGMKVLYIEVFQELLNFPPLTVTAGKILWATIIPIYWAIAFVVTAAIPQFSYVSGFVGALFILSFTYTLPALLALGYFPKKDAMVLEEERFDPTTRTYNYVDTGVKRYVRGYMKRPLFNSWNVFYLLGGLVTTALGMYSAIEGMIDAFNGKSVATSFGCTPPV